MARILGIDFGFKRTGLAVTDPLNMFAQPLETIATNTFPDWLKKYQSAEMIQTFVVGLPTQLDGSDTDATQAVKDFIDWLKGNYPNIPVETIDERFSSHEAQHHIIQSVAKKDKRREKGLVDTVAATLILQTYLQKNA